MWHALFSVVMWHNWKLKTVDELERGTVEMSVSEERPKLQWRNHLNSYTCNVTFPKLFLWLFALNLIECFFKSVRDATCFQKAWIISLCSSTSFFQKAWYAGFTTLFQLSICVEFYGQAEVLPCIKTQSMKFKERTKHKQMLKSRFRVCQTGYSITNVTESPIHQNIRIPALFIDRWAFSFPSAESLCITLPALYGWTVWCPFFLSVTAM